jgi:hypothetical protein
MKSLEFEEVMLAEALVEMAAQGVAGVGEVCEHKNKLNFVSQLMMPAGSNQHGDFPVTKKRAGSMPNHT